MSETKPTTTKPRDNLESHAKIGEPKFYASYEKDSQSSRIPMSCLLGWEYGRKWYEERDEYLKAERSQDATKASAVAPEKRAASEKRSS